MKTWKPIQFISDNLINKQYTPSATVLVKIGDNLEPTTPLVKTRNLGGYHAINIAEQLKIKPTDLTTYCKLKPGSNIFQGELIAQKKELFKLEPRTIRSPTDGIVEDVNSQTGKVIIKITHPTKTIPAGLWGTVMDITKDDEKYEITIKSNTLQFTGKVGRGFNREGILQILTKRFESADPFMITPEHQGKILVVGGTLKERTIEQAIDCHVAGIVVGSMHYYNIKSIAENSDVGVSILCIEGFGEHPINDETYNALQKQEHYYSIINPVQGTLLCAVEPEKSYRIESSAEKRVRVTWGEHIGLIGTIRKEHEAVAFPSGLIAKGLELQAGSQSYLVPLNNVEVLE